MAVKPGHKQLFVTLQESLIKNLKKLADYENKTLSKYLQAVLRDHVKSKEVLLDDDDDY